MPASSYSHQKNPKTGEMVWVPQLFPYSSSTGGMEPGELENWVNLGIVPKELYENYEAQLIKREEIHKRIKNGETVLSSEFTDPSQLLNYIMENKARIYGENVLTKIFSRLDDNDPDIVWLSFIKEATSSIALIDPVQIHIYTARKTLKEKYKIDDTRAIDILSRKLLEHCINISKFKSFFHRVFDSHTIDFEDLENHFGNEKQDMLQVDMEFINYLKGIGSKGKKLASDLKETCEELFKYYKDEGYPSTFRRKVWGLWVPENSLINPVLTSLAQASWEEECCRIWNLEIKGHPSIAKPVIDIIIPILSPIKNKKFIEKDGSITFTDQNGNPIFSAPAIDPIMINSFKNGVKQLGTLTGHKMLRWQVNTGFERWAQGLNDHRMIEIDGGYSTIANLIGCGNQRDIAKVKEILHIQAFGRFTFSNGTHGNMITLNITDRHRNQEPSKIKIGLGDILLPSYVCQLHGKDKLLVPIGDLPPLHGSPNSHASQAQLQLLVFKELSNQSKRLAESGSVLILPDLWEKLAIEAGVSLDKIKLVVNHWCQPDLFNCFLERQGDEYRLASFYERAQKFLEDQGRRRIINSQRGKNSVEKRIKNSKKI